MVRLRTGTGTTARCSGVAVRAVLAVFVVMTTGCSSVEVGADPWSRTYLATPERVFGALTEVLEDEGYHLERVDDERLRVRAHASARRGDDVILMAEVEPRRAGVVVTVMAGGSSVQDGRAPGPLDRAVDEVLRRLDIRLEGQRD
jgi:hypothetical protein